MGSLVRLFPGGYHVAPGKQHGTVRPGHRAPGWAPPLGWLCACCGWTVANGGQCSPCTILRMEQCGAPRLRGGTCTRWARGGGRCHQHKAVASGG
jgi:hypothetical protein